MGEMIKFRVNDLEISAYQANSKAEPKAGLVVLQEWWGVVPHIKAVADRFAALGYQVLAPDLYHGQKTVDAEEAEHLMNGLDWALAIQEIQASVSELRRQTCEKVGVVGFCMGGALSCLASATANVEAAVAFYGFPPEPNPMDKKCPPTLIFFGDDEPFFDVAAAKAWASKQQKLGVKATEIEVFAGAGHAFFNDTRPEAYNEEAAKTAFEKTTKHFAQHLKI